MSSGEIWGIALDALRTNKVKAFLTMLGVVIGSACIVLVVTVSLTGKRYIIAQIEGVGSNLIYAELIRSGPQQATILGDEISLADMEVVRREIPQVVEVAGTRETPMTVVVASVEHPVNLVGVTTGFQRIRNLVILRGRFFDNGDMESRSKVCLLTEELAKVIFRNDDPIGKDIRVGELSFTVIGVFRERVATFGQSEITRESVIIPFPLLRYYTGVDFLKVLYVQSARPEDVILVTRQVEQVLKSQHRPGAAYNVQNLTSILEAAQKISAALTVTLLLIACMALVISGVGIMNIMLVTVTERTREIGIRKAIGARSREILYQFLIEALMISGTGAIAGIVIAILIPILARPLIPGNLVIPISRLSVVVAFTVSCLTGILFGYLPANKAARLQPTEALRYE
ncbi:MAG: ABC transporter permease [Acidobacteria bacterium]|nr:ABC transporter permease [Acidobacteriota bacterium]